VSTGMIAGMLLLAAADPTPAAGLAARKDALARYGAGVWQARRDRLLTAAKSFEAAAKDDPDSTAALKELVRIYSQLGREPDAVRVARTVLENDPDDADTAHQLARLLFDAGETVEAVAVARTAAANVDATTRPDKALAVYRDLATLLDAANDSKAAELPLRKAVALLTENRKAVLATRAFTPKDLDADAADTFERLGKVLVKAGKADAAVAAFAAAHARYADPLGANDAAAAARLDWNLSAALAAKGNAAAALTHLEAFLKLRPQAVEPYERLASLVAQVGSGAATALQKYVVREPKNLPLLAVFAAELARDPETRPKAEAYFVQLSAATNDPKIVKVLIRSWVETGQPRQVVAELDRAYLALKDDGPGEARAFAAEKARVVADLLRADPDWANAVLGAAADDLRGGTKRTHQTWHVLGLLAARNKKLDFAVVQFQRAVRGATPETQGDAYVQLIGVLWRLRKPAEVAAVCRDGLRNATNTVSPVLFNIHLAQALADLGDSDDAIAAADKAILQAADTDRLSVRLTKVRVLNLLGRWDDAVALCKKLLDEFDGPADRTRVRYALAAAYWGAKKNAESEAELRGILDADPDHAGACNDLGYHLADRGQNLDEAERLVRRAVALDRADRRAAGDPEPESAAYLDSLAWVLFRRARLPEARALLEKVSAMPDGAADAVVWDHLGDVCFRAGDKAGAKAAWDKAAALYATDPRGAREGRGDEVARKLKRIP